MARARNIKPKFFQNDELGEINPLGRLLFIGLWTIADFKGCLEFRPKRVKTQLLPYDECDVEQLAFALDKSGFISIYSVRGQRYIKILKFKEHQNPHKNEKDAGSDCPDISEKDCEINELSKDGSNRDKNGTDRAVSLFPLPESCIPIESEPSPDAVDIPFGVEHVEKRAKRRPSEDDYKTARWLFGCQKGINAEAKTPNFDTWADDVRLMREIDKRDHRAICELFKFAKNDSFWSPNIQSPAKLREKWDVLTELRSRPGKADGKKESRHAGFDKLDYSEGINDDGKF